jgi:ABC-type multidrug transport system fused ATPase/permease subunit
LRLPNARAGGPVAGVRTEVTIQSQAQENSTFIETVRAIQTLKIFNREEEREGQWLNRYSDVVSANVRLGRTKIAFSTVNEVIFGLENIITIYLAARLALANAFTVGMIFAFMSYKQNFTDKAVQLIEKAIDFRILGLHLERLSDIALTPIEAGHDQPIAYTREIEGDIELRNVSFRYSETDAYVLRDIDLKIAPGEFVSRRMRIIHCSARSARSLASMTSASRRRTFSSFSRRMTSTRFFASVSTASTRASASILTLSMRVPASSLTWSIPRVA